MKISLTRLVVFRASAVILTLTWILSVTPSQAQEDRKLLRQGNSKYYDGRFNESEILYRKALDKNSSSYNAKFNLGDALYRQNNFEEASRNFIASSELQNDRIKKSKSYYNLGNSLLKNNKIAESIEAYKNSLRLDPSNIQAKHNLAFAQDLLKQQQQQQQQQQQNQDNNKDQKQDQDKNRNDRQQDQQKQDQQQQQQQQQQQGMTREDAARILEALSNDEKKVQEKVKDAKAAGERVRTLINW